MAAWWLMLSPNRKTKKQLTRTSSLGATIRNRNSWLQFVAFHPCAGVVVGVVEADVNSLRPS